MFSEDVIAEMRKAADTFAARIAPGADDPTRRKNFGGTKTVRFTGLAALTPAFLTILDNDIFHSVASAMLLPCCGSYWLNTAQIIYIGPGEKAQVLHRDASNWWQFVQATWPHSPEITLSSMIGLDHVSEELGATRVLPGSHRWTNYERYVEAETVAAELGPGDALLYSGYVVHGGGANRTADRTRRAMHMSVVAGWLTPEEAHPLDFSRADGGTNGGLLAAQPARVQRMLGHRSYDPRPHQGGGLWLRHARPMEECTALS